MKIELKNIKTNASLSFETQHFSANLIIDGKDVGIAYNEGCGGNTFYRAKNDENQKIILKAEEYCKKLPKIETESFTFESSLEFVIDDLVEKFMFEKDNVKFIKKMKKVEKDSILIGTMERYTIFNLKLPIEQILTMKGGQESLKRVLIQLKPKLINGNKILNTNIPETILRDIY